LMLKAGVEFSAADVELITGGEISEAGCAFGKVAGWDELNSALNDIFEGV
jgi:hypothetical protein